MKKQRELEKQITDEVINDLFNIFINSEDYLQFRFKIEKEGYKNALHVWKIFYPKYDSYRQDNLKNNQKK